MKYHEMAGGGIIRCSDCDFSENITSFFHWHEGARTGYQCERCGKFTSRDFHQPERDEELKSFFEYPSDPSPALKAKIDQCEALWVEAEAAYAETLFCECGGALQRDNMLFCPMCKSKNLRYRMMVIT